LELKEQNNSFANASAWTPTLQVVTKREFRTTRPNTNFETLQVHMQDWSKLQNQKMKVREELKGERGRQEQHKCQPPGGRSDIYSTVQNEE
jgi:predicted RNA-binding protein with RPS1 domain